MNRHALTPFQPTGPYPQVMLDLPTGKAAPLAGGVDGERITILGALRDGAGNAVTDALIELWQADAHGRYAHPADPAAGDADPAFFGYRRVSTDGQGEFEVATVRPGRVAGPDGAPQAPHILIGVCAGGILTRYVTRMYFADQAANVDDPILRLVPAHRRTTLLAEPEGNDVYRFAIALQGERETVFFDL